MNIESILLPDEKVLYRGVAVSEKGSKSIFGLIIGIFFCIMIILIINEKIDEIILDLFGN